MFRALTKKITAKRGFTLMEILVVVGIIAVIAAISITGILNIRENLAFRQKNDYAKSIFMAAQTHLTELRASNGLEHLQNISHLDANMNELDNPDTLKEEYADYKYTHTTDSAYSTVLPIGSVDAVIREENVIIEYNPVTGNVYAVFYSEDDMLLSMYRRQETEPNYHLPRNGEGDEELRKEMMLGYYDGSDLSGAELGLMHMKADIRFENGEEGLVTVIVPTQDEKDTSFSIADDGNYNRYMSGLTVKLTVVGEQSGSFETVIKEAGSFDSSSCYPSIDPRTGAQVIHITFPIDSLKDNGSFADLASVTDNGSTTYLIQPGDNVSITAEVTYASSATDPIVEIEDAMVAGVNPMFHSLTPGNGDKYILTLSNGRNLQNLNLLSSEIAQNVESVIFVNPDGSTTDVIIDWNDTVEYYNEKYGSGYTNSIYTNEPAEAPGRALPHFVPIMNETLLGTPAAVSTCTINGNGVKIYDLSIDNSARDNAIYANTGLFATANTSIDGISIVNPVIRGSSSGTTGALVGELQLNGTVSNCGVYVDTEDIDFVRSKLNMSSFDGSDAQYGVSGSGAVGGLIGYSMSTETVKSSFAAVPVYGTKSTSDFNGFGGLVGFSSQTDYQKCYASGTVNAQSTANDYGAGGFVGTSSNSNYTNCFATGDVKTTTGEKGCAGFVGVLLFENQNPVPTFDSCYSLGLGSLNEDFCGYTNITSAPERNYYASSTGTNYVFKDSYYLTQNTEGTTDYNTHTKKCATALKYDDLTKLHTRPIETVKNELTSLLGEDHVFRTEDYNNGYPVTTIWGSASVANTYAYDTQSASHYPFTMLNDLNYYGNWPRKRLDVGIAYYEVYQYENGDTEFGFYFDRDSASTLLKNNVHESKYFTVIDDGYVILSTSGTSITVNGDTIPQVSADDTIPSDVFVYDQTTKYAVFLLDDEQIVPTGSNFYSKISVSLNSSTHTFYCNSNVAMSHINPANNSTTATDPGASVPSTIYIRTARQLAAVGENMASFWDENYIQQLDIDFNKYQGGTALVKAPIGSSSIPFTGSYIGRKDDGKTPAIVGYKPPDATNTGIFGVIGKNGVVRNLNLETGSSAISGGGDSTTSIGLLAGKNQGTIEKVNVTVNGTVTLNASATAGLLVGENSGKLINCRVSQNDGIATLNAAHAGGLVGSVSEGSELEKISVTLNKLSGNGILAGVFGKVGADVTISDIPFLFIGTGANITSSGSAAGFVGESAGTIMDCSVRGDGTISGTTSAAGFAVKVTGGTVDGCVVSPAEDFEDYAGNSNSNLRISSASAAGFVVTNNAVTTENKNDCIRSCTALGTVTGNSGNAAGFVITNSGTIEYCMSNVDMTTGTVFAKRNNAETSSVKECYGWADSTVKNADEPKNFQNIVTDSNGKYFSSYFGLMDSEKNIALFDFNGTLANYPTATLSQASTLNKLTGGSGRSAWTRDSDTDQIAEYPYDTVNLTNYPYPMLREHYGNWPIPTDAYECGIIYYEKYSETDWGVHLINMTDISEESMSIQNKDTLLTSTEANVADAGYALFCKIDATPFCNETNAMIGSQMMSTNTYAGLYSAAGLAPLTDAPYVYGLYPLDNSELDPTKSIEVTVENINRTVSVDLVPLFADTLDNTREPFRIRTQEHLENIKHLPAGKFVIDRCFSVDKSFSSIPTFSGELTGLDGAEVTATDIASGLINKANGAVIDGVKLTATMSVKLEPASLNVIGTLVNEATDSTITNCTIRTDIMVSTSEPAAQAEDSSEAESDTEASEPPVQKGTVTIGGIIGRMQGGILSDSAVSSSKTGITTTANATELMDAYQIHIGGAVGEAASSGNEQFGSYENVHAAVTITPRWQYEKNDIGNIGEFVGYVRGGTFTNCSGKDTGANRPFLGDIMNVPDSSVKPAYYSNSKDGPYTPYTAETSPQIIHYNATFENCTCDNGKQEILEDVYYFSNENTAYHKGNLVSGVTATLTNLSVTELDNMIVNEHDYYILDEDTNKYHRVTISSSNDVESGAKSYTFTYSNGKTKTWTPDDNNPTCSMLYTLELNLNLRSDKQYVIFTEDGSLVLHLANGLSFNTQMSAATLCSVSNGNLHGTEQSYYVSGKVPDVYCETTHGIALIDSSEKPVELTLDGVKHDRFCVYEVNESYGDPIAISYKCVFTPAT